MWSGLDKAGFIVITPYSSNEKDVSSMQGRKPAVALASPCIKLHGRSIVSSVGLRIFQVDEQVGLIKYVSN